MSSRNPPVAMTDPVNGPGKCPYTSAMASTPHLKQPAQPLIPTAYVGETAQWLFVKSIGALIQVMKIMDYITIRVGKDDLYASCKRWLFIDFAYSVVFAQLRIPGLSNSKIAVLIQIILLWSQDGAMFSSIGSKDSQPHGGVGLFLPAAYAALDRVPPQVEAPQEAFNLFNALAPYSFGLISSDLPEGTTHTNLLGAHTVYKSPINTAKLNPDDLTFCIAPGTDAVYIPVLLDNVKLSGLRYDISPLSNVDDAFGKVESFDMSSKQFKIVEQQRVDDLHRRRSPGFTGKRDSQLFDEKAQTTFATLQRTQTLVHLKVSRPGVVRLDRILDAANADTTIDTAEVTVAPCPRVAFLPVSSNEEDTRCSGQDTDYKLGVELYGIPPLTLSWSRTVNGKREHFTQEDIDRGGDDYEYSRKFRYNTHSEDSIRREGRSRATAQEIRYPLAISLDAVGDHLYTLEEIRDSLGNTVHVGSDLITTDRASTSRTKTTRSFMVFHRPMVSFKDCGPGSPLPMLVGHETPLAITSNKTETFDAGWEVLLKYQPPTDVTSNSGRRLVPWEQTFKTQANRRDIHVPISAPGDYSIVQVKGKYCKGEVVAPDNCKVVEKALPTATINWKRIQDCSGESGIAAALSLEGTPPFQVTYRIQRDSDPPHELSKTLTGSEDELIIQPARSGRYVYTFLHMSDANYRKVELQGPTIDQNIPRPARAQILSGQVLPGLMRRSMTSCETGTLGVDVQLEGIGPWDLEIRMASVEMSDTIWIRGIKTARETLKIPVPDSVDGEGLTVEIDLLTVDDSRHCRQSLEVPGLSVGLRPNKPSVAFQGEQVQRQITILDGDRATLPLLLTGQGPWRLKYRRAELDQLILSMTFTTPKSFLPVTDEGLYELLEVSDSQCVGIVNQQASSYKVDWIPRPSAKLAPETSVTYDGYNKSYILRPICQGMDDHVDIDLTGRPPFQITYNIAQRANPGVSKLLYQPSYNSVSHRSRLQLHTSHPGRVHYEVHQLGDAAYPLAKQKANEKSRPDRLQFEQQVSFRPSAKFKSLDQLYYYMQDAFVPADSRSTKGTIVLQGTPPFRLQLSVKNLATKQTDIVTAETKGHTWKIHIPSYAWKAVGLHSVTIDAVFDASNCGHASLDSAWNSIMVDVAATASIVPLDQREDYCVGDDTSFLIDGSPPWTVGYRVNGIPYNKEFKVSPFTVHHDRPGEFSITSITHQRLRKAINPPLRYAVHALPSALIGHGKVIYQDINEGDQAEIVFTLIGEPPFTFTYQRSEPPVKAGGKPGRVLETHTVSHVTSHTYSIYASLEGTWTVTFISDGFCQFPHVQPGA